MREEFCVLVAAGQDGLGAFVCFQVKTLLVRDVRSPLGILEINQRNIRGCAGRLEDFNVADGNGVVGCAVAKLEAEHQLAAVGAGGGKLSAVGARTGQVVHPFVVVTLGVVPKQDLKFARLTRRANIRTDAVFLSGLRRHSGGNQKLGAPDSAAVAAARMGDMQGCRAARGGDLLFDPVSVLLPHISARAVVDRTQILGCNRHAFYAEIAQGHGIARGAVRLAQLQAQRQRAVAGVRRDDVLDLVCAARGQAAAI